jgi:hypothetical protein
MREDDVARRPVRSDADRLLWNRTSGLPRQLDMLREVAQQALVALATGHRYAFGNPFLRRWIRVSA